MSRRRATRARSRFRSPARRRGGSACGRTPRPARCGAACRRTAAILSPASPGAAARAPGASRGRTMQSVVDDTQPALARAAQRLADVRCLHEAEARAHGVHVRHAALDPGARGTVVARRALDLEVQDHDLLVADVVVLEVAQQRRGHEAAMAHQEHRGARARCVAPAEQLRQFRSTARRALQLGAQRGAAVAPGDEHAEHRRRRCVSGTQPPFGILVTLPATNARSTQQEQRRTPATTRQQRPLPVRCARPGAEQRRDAAWCRPPTRRRRRTARSSEPKASTKQQHATNMKMFAAGT